MKSSTPIKVLLVLSCLETFGVATQVQVNFNSGSQFVLDAGGNKLTPGGVDDGDGAVIQLGYFDGATTVNNFAGTWHALTGMGSLNTGGQYNATNVPPSPLRSLNFTSIGDVGGGAAPDGSGIFGISVVFDSNVTGTFNDLTLLTTAIPLAIRFYDGTTTAITGTGASSKFNTVSNDAWLWKAPANPNPFPPTIEMSLNDLGLEWQSIAVAGQSPTTAFRTSMSLAPVPEPLNFAFGALAALTALSSRRRSR